MGSRSVIAWAFSEGGRDGMGRWVNMTIGRAAVRRADVARATWVR